MKYLLSFLYCITSICSAMENKGNIIAELTCVPNPTRAVFLIDDLIAIAGNNGGSICNYRTNTEIAKICTFAMPLVCLPSLQVHPNKKIVAFGEYHKEVIIYNVETKEIWNKDLDLSHLLFNPVDDTIFIQDTADRTTTVHNYKNKSEAACSLAGLSGVKLESFHPTQSNICLCVKNNVLNSRVWNKDSFTKPKIIHNKDRKLDGVCCCIYSGDGSLIAMITNPNGINIFDSKSNTEKHLPQSCDYHVWDMIFHPTSFILAGLSPSFPSTLLYWNTKTHMLITEEKLLEKNIASNYTGPRLSFSGDGTKIIVMIQYRCLILEVPFSVLYKDVTKEKAIFIYWLLKKYQSTQNNILPDEIVQELIKKLLVCSKYSFTNY